MLVPFKISNLVCEKGFTYSYREYTFRKYMGVYVNDKGEVEKVAHRCGWLFSSRITCRLYRFYMVYE